MKCVNCGADVDDKYRFCQYCGTMLPTEKTTMVINNTYVTDPKRSQRPIDLIDSIYDVNYMLVGKAYFDLNLIIRMCGKSKFSAASLICANTGINRKSANNLLEPYYEKFRDEINHLNIFQRMKAQIDYNVQTKSNK